MNHFQSALLVLLFSLIPLAAGAAEYDGAELYMANCSNCHGVYGEGDGIVTPALAVVLQDLRYISEQNGGTFPRQVITEIIDGRDLRVAHGPDGMPVWGNAFSHTEGYSDAAQSRVGAKIEALVDFVESMQIHSD
ncbi:MAG: cytochrome c [Gammaproteobacteria bacterium]|nr:cytochrome c [Gammaproteobacteria bacterium]